MSATRIIMKLLASFEFRGVWRVTFGLSSVGPPPWFKTTQLLAISSENSKIKLCRSFLIRHRQKVCQDKTFFWIVGIVSAHAYTIFFLVINILHCTDLCLVTER